MTLTWRSAEDVLTLTNTSSASGTVCGTRASLRNHPTHLTLPLENKIVPRPSRSLSRFIRSFASYRSPLAAGLRHCQRPVNPMARNYFCTSPRAGPPSLLMSVTIPRGISAKECARRGVFASGKKDGISGTEFHDGGIEEDRVRRHLLRVRRI